MSEQELKEFVQAMAKLRLTNTSTSEKAQQFLKDEGILTKEGTLAEPYAPGGITSRS